MPEIKTNALQLRLWTVVALLLLSLAAAPRAYATSKDVLEVEVNDALARFKKDVSGASVFLGKAKGVLVFPSVYKAGVGIGGEYGEGALRIGGKTVDYYNTVAASVGFQLGAQARTVILIFLKEDALKKFRHSEGWKAGVDGSVALVTLGVGEALDTINVTDPIVGFIFGEKGLMYNLTLEGSKFTKIKK